MGTWKRLLIWLYCGGAFLYSLLPLGVVVAILVFGDIGSYVAIDFLALLVGHAISGEPTLSDFFERLAPFGTAFMAMFGRKSLPHRSSLSRYLADVDEF
jgi:hypothetical protein